MKWPCDWNRPLSKEERAIAKRLDNAPKDGVARPSHPADGDGGGEEQIAKVEGKA